MTIRSKSRYRRFLRTWGTGPRARSPSSNSYSVDSKQSRRGRICRRRWRRALKKAKDVGVHRLVWNGYCACISCSRRSVYPTKAWMMPSMMPNGRELIWNVAMRPGERRALDMACKIDREGGQTETVKASIRAKVEPPTSSRIASTCKKARYRGFGQAHVTADDFVWGGESDDRQAPIASNQPTNPSCHLEMRVDHRPAVVFVFRVVTAPRTTSCGMVCARSFSATPAGIKRR